MFLEFFFYFNITSPLNDRESLTQIFNAQNSSTAIKWTSVNDTILDIFKLYVVSFYKLCF